MKASGGWMLRFLGMQRFLGLFVLLTMIGSIAFGWAHKPWWLIVPPLVLLGAVFRTSAYTAARMAESGISTVEFWSGGVIGRNVGFALLNTAYNVGGFFVFWFIAAWLVVCEKGVFSTNGELSENAEGLWS
jgi:hypothetical protein